MTNPLPSSRWRSLTTTGFVSVFCLGVAFVLVADGSTGDRLLFGPFGSLIVLTAALSVVIIAVVAVLRTDTAARWRGAVLLVGTGLLVAVVVMAVDSVLVASLPYFLIALLFAGGALGLGRILGQLFRNRVTFRDESGIDEGEG